MYKYLLLILIAGLSLQSCKKEGCTDPLANNYNSEAKKDDGSCVYDNPGPTYSSSVNFSNLINGAAFFYDTILYPHPGGQQFSVETLKYFVSNIVLHQNNGDSVVLKQIHYIDAEVSSTQTALFNSSIPNGDYTGISLTFGLDASLNVDGIYNNPPESLMEWPVPMGGGYHYMKMEGKYDSLGTIKNYNTHTGGLMGNDYSVSIVLNQAFTVSDNSVDIQLAMELLNWYQNPNLYQFDVYGEAIMGNAAAQQALMENGADVFSIISIN